MSIEQMKKYILSVILFTPMLSCDVKQSEESTLNVHCYAEPSRSMTF